MSLGDQTWKCLGFALVDRFDMCVHVLFVAERSSADLARERLQSLVNSVDVSLQVLLLSKLFPTLVALVWLQSLVNSLGVCLQVLSLSKLFPTLVALVWLEFLVDLSDVLVKTPFFCECLATRWTSAAVHIRVDCALVFHQS